MQALEKELWKLEAVNEIQNLMGSYSFLLDGRKYDELVDLFSKTQADVRVELGGVYVGLESISRLYMGKHYEQHAGGHYPGYEGRGIVAKHPQNTPLVVVGEDGKTAKGTWISLGFSFFLQEERKEQHWGMFRYGADFIYENGHWKIWHLRVYDGFMTDGNHSWSNPRPRPMPPEGRGLPENGPRPDKFPSDLPPTSGYRYDVKTPVPYAPEVPEAYAVFDPKYAN